MTWLKEMMKNYYDLKLADITDTRSWDMPIVEADVSLLHIFKMLRGNEHVWVVESKKNPVLLGVITEKDIIRALAPPELHTYRYTVPFSAGSLYHASEVSAKTMMNSKLVTCTKNCRVREVLIKMFQYRIRRVPVVENGILKGEVTINTLISLFLKMLTRMENDLKDNAARNKE